MNKKIYIGAITLVIAGLMITSATGMGKPTQIIPTTQTKSEPIPMPELKSINRDAMISKYLSGNGLEKFAAASQVTKKVNILGPQLQKAAISAETTSMDATYTSVKKAVDPAKQNTRTDYTLYDTHPGVGDAGLGNLLLVNQEYYAEDGVPVYTEAMPFSGSNDYGMTWGDSIYFVDTNNDPLAYGQPSLAYWGKNGSLDRFYSTFRDDSTPPTSTGDIQLMKWETTPTTIVDLLNASNEGVYWAFSTNGFSDIKHPQIAATDMFEPWYWGMMSMTISKTGSGNQMPAYCLQAAENGSASLYSYSLYNALGNDISISDTSNFAGICWDPIYTTHGHCLLLEWTRSDEHVTGEYKTYIWYDSGGYQTFYPAIATNANDMIVASEVQNITAGTLQELEIDHFTGTTTTPIDYSWTEGAGWASTQYRLLYPEVKHVQADTYIVTCIAQNISNPQDVSVLLTVSYDTGATWSDLYTWSENDEVKAEYRAIEMPVGGSVLFWEYQYYTENPNDDIVFLHFVPLTVQLQGKVFYPQPFHDRATPTSVVVENLDPVDGKVIPGVTIQTTADYDYFMKLLLGFDIWTNATIKVTASQPGYSGFTTQLYDNIIHPFQDVNQQDVDYAKCVPPTQPTDITVWHTLTADQYKGIRGQTYTYQSTSTETGSLDFIFFWGDGTNTTVTSVTTGTASATHIYALGTYSITAKVQRAGQPSSLSNPSTARTVNMYKVGDMTLDNAVNWRDIDPFVAAMSGKTAYYTAFPAGYYYTGDCSFDGTVNWRDIDPFVALMGSK